jgi:hypothetical protein
VLRASPASPGTRESHVAISSSVPLITIRDQIKGKEEEGQCKKGGLANGLLNSDLH